MDKIHIESNGLGTVSEPARGMRSFNIHSIPPAELKICSNKNVRTPKKEDGDEMSQKGNKVKISGFGSLPILGLGILSISKAGCRVRLHDENAGKFTNVRDLLQSNKGLVEYSKINSEETENLEDFEPNGEDFLDSIDQTDCDLSAKELKHSNRYEMRKIVRKSTAKISDLKMGGKNF